MLRLHWDSGTHDLRDTGAMLYQLSYEASLESGQVQVDICYEVMVIVRSM